MVRKPICDGETLRDNKNKKFLKFNLDVDLNNGNLSVYKTNTYYLYTICLDVKSLF